MSAFRRSPLGLRAPGALLLALAALLIPAQSAFAEGSVDVYSGAETALRQKLTVGTEVNAPYHRGYTMLRVYAQAGETIEMGSSAMGLGGSSDILVYAPGTSFASETEAGRRATYPSSPVFGTDVFDCDADAPATGRIASRAEEVAGPLPDAGGYTPCEYTAPTDGIYSVMMVPYDVGGSGGGASTLANPDVTTAQAQTISIWDVTVRDAAGVIQPGRVFTDLLHWKTNSPAGAATNLTTYVYTPAGQIYRVELFNPHGLTSDLAANGSGVVDATTGEPIGASFQWGLGNNGYPATLEPTHGEAVAPQLWAGETEADARYPIFFHTPDPVALGGPGGLGETRGYPATPMAPEGGLTSALSFEGAGGDAGSTTTGAGGAIKVAARQLQGEEYDVTIDLDHNGTFGGGSDVEYNGTLGGSGGTFAWDGRDAGGEVVPCGASYDYQVTSTLPAMHIVSSDTANLAGIEIDRQTLTGDLLLGDPPAASYDEIDPYKGTAVTNSTPSSVTDGTSGPTFHSWSGNTGHTDFTDTWTAAARVDGTGTFEVRCPSASTSPATGTGTGTGTETSTGTGTASTSTRGSTKSPSSPEAPKHPKKHNKHAHHKQPTRATGPRLTLNLDAGTSRARPSSVIGYGVTVNNSGGSAARDVEVCDDPPAGQRVLRTFPTATGKDVPCWTIPTLAAGAQRVFRLTTMVEEVAPSGDQVDHAWASGANVKGVSRDRAAVSISPLPETACGASLAARPLTFSRTLFRC